MSDRPLITNEGALKSAEVIGTSVANSAATPTPLVGKLVLFDGTLVPTAVTTLAEIMLAETALVGYPPGGYSITDMKPAIFAPGGGAIVQTNLVNVVYASGASATIGGYALVDSDGDSREVFIFDPQRVLAEVGDGFPVVASLGFGKNT